MSLYVRLIQVILDSFSLNRHHYICTKRLIRKDFYTSYLIKENFLNIFDYCEEGLGMITISVSGGVPPYEISWCIDQDSIGSAVMDTSGYMTIDSLSPGNYNFIDAERCEN